MTVKVSARYFSWINVFHVPLDICCLIASALIKGCEPQPNPKRIEA